MPGVGKRTAQRLLIELKARLEVPDFDLAEATGGTSTPRGEVRDALVGLGYSTEEVRRRARPAHRRSHRRGAALRAGDADAGASRARRAMSGDRVRASASAKAAVE